MQLQATTVRNSNLAISMCFRCRCLTHRSCLECFSPSSPCPLPTQLQAYLHTLQDHLLSGPVWASGSIMYDLLAAG
jgi:hypothetical protein